jgi:hypothetical protein
MENKKKSSVKDRLNAKQAKKIGKQQREYIPYDWALIFKANGRNMISGRVKFLLLAWAGMTKTSFRKNSDSLEACLVVDSGCSRYSFHFKK